MSKFVDRLITTAQTNLQHIVLPESTDSRIVEAARQIASRNIARVTLLGNPSDVQADGVTVLNWRTSPDRDRYARTLAELRKNKGMTLADAYKLLDDPLYFGTMMIKLGDADGMTAGACHATSDVIRPALQILKCAPGCSIASSFFEISVPNCPYGENGTFFFADCGLNTYPNEDQLAEIGVQTAHSWKEFMGTTPRVAFLSHSSYGSANNEHSRFVRAAVQKAHALDPTLEIDGELQLDAALVPEVAQSKAPDSPVAGRANILIFPNLDAGNIGYKIAQRLARAEALGPVLQGLAGPVNDLSRGCSVADAVGVIALTAVQAQRLHQTQAR